MRLIENHFGRKQVYVFEGLYLAFTVLTYYFAKAGMDRSAQPKLLWKVVLASITGPMEGAIARNFQGCCLEFSLALLPFCGGALLIATGLQFVRLPFGRFNTAFRLTAWTLGVLVWFLGIPVSFAHAFE